MKCKRGDSLFVVGDTPDYIYYIQKGTVQLSVVSIRGKEAIIDVLGPGDFVGECFIGGRRVRLTNATVIAPSDLVRISKKDFLRRLRWDKALSGAFICYLFARKLKAEESLVDQLFNSTEKRLARALLLLAQYGKQGKTASPIPKISQTMLAEMIGTTRSRISTLMNKLRRLRLITYDRGSIQVHNSLLNIVLNEGLLPEK